MMVNLFTKWNLFKRDILASPYTPFTTVKITKSTDKVTARIGCVTLLDSTDSAINNDSYLFETNDLTNSLEGYDTYLTYQNLTCTPLDSAYRVNQRKPLTYLLTNKALRLAEVSVIGINVL